jgi:hypothetical protein
MPDFTGRTFAKLGARGKKNKKYKDIFFHKNQKWCFEGFNANLFK